jgi:hypothetical protein
VLGDDADDVIVYFILFIFCMSTAKTSGFNHINKGGKCSFSYFCVKKKEKCIPN